MKIRNMIFSDEIDNCGDLEIETSEDSHFHWLNREHAVAIIAHLTKVFSLADVRGQAVTDALQLKRGEGLVLIRVDKIKSLECLDYKSRNNSCLVNGIRVDEGYDFVRSALGWNPIEIK